MMDPLEMFAKLSQTGFVDHTLLKSLTKDELETLELERSWDWCGTYWEEKDKDRIKKILRARTDDSIVLKKIHYRTLMSEIEARRNFIGPRMEDLKETHFMKKILPFLFR